MPECNIFQRVEKKYMLTPAQYELFMDAVKGKISPDQYGLHTISNIYYDTESYDLIRQSIEKPKYKEKFRLRGYGTVTDDSRIFLEIKKKYQGVVYKRRTALLLKDAKRYLEEGVLPEPCDQIMKEIDYFFKFYHPIPQLYLAYDRVAYQGTEDSQLRITIDRNIRSRTNALDLAYGDEGDIVSKDFFLMEIKVPMAYPMWLASILSSLNIYPISFSKYGTVYKNAVLDRKIMPWIWTEKSNKHPALQWEDDKGSEGEETCLQVYSAV